MAAKGNKPIKIKESEKGSLHKALGVKADAKIPEKKLAKAEKSKDPALKKKAIFAQNAKGWAKKK